MSAFLIVAVQDRARQPIAREVAQRFAADVDVFHFDQIGVPSPELMQSGHGSAEGWQRARTIEWMAKLGSLSKARRALLFEGQTRLSFLAEGAAAAGIPAYIPILIDCDDETRSRRLLVERKQPELVE